MNPEDIGRILDEIGERIGPAGEYAWTVLVTGERVWGMVHILIAAITGIACAVMVRLAFWAYRKHQDGGAYDSHDIGAVAFGGAAALLLIGTVVELGFGLVSALAPEYAVLKDIIGGGR